MNGCDQFKVTTESTVGVAFQHTSAVSLLDNMKLECVGGYLMRVGEGSATDGLTIVGVDSGTSVIRARGSASILSLTSQTSLSAVADTSMTLAASLGTMGISSTAAMTLNSSVGNNIILQTASVARLTVSNGMTTLTNGISVALTAAITGLTTMTGGFTSSAASAITSTFSINQGSANYVQPFTIDTRLGYTDTKTINATAATNTLTSMGTWTLPAAGVWLIIAGITVATTTTADINYVRGVISLTSGGGTPAAPGLNYFDDNDQIVGGTGDRESNTICGVVTVANSSTPYYANGQGDTTSATDPTMSWSISWTKIG